VDSQEDTESEAEMARARREVAESVRQHAQQGRGKVPAGLARWAEVELAPPVIPWQRRLARVVRTAVAWRPGAVDLRYTTPSRRQAGLGFGAGRAVLPAYQRPVPKVGIGLDTSGSMGTAELAASLAEVQGVLKAVGAEVSFCSCDSKVHEGAKGSVRTVKEARKLVKGGGGTSFLPIFETLAKDRCEVIIICTDGCGPAPAQAPRGMRVIWVLMGPFARKPCAWGDHIFLPQQEAR
jgi:predicted metal-dependent peptidase